MFRFNKDVIPTDCEPGVTRKILCYSDDLMMCEISFKKGSKAPECAGIIHSDFEKGFIRAEVTSFSDLEKYGDEKLVKEAGKLRVEGKEYEMQDGDICYFRFNV